MPAISVYEFAQRISQYVSDNLNHKEWHIDKIIAVYSTRSKETKFGYKVVPLFAGAIATDEHGKATHCRINFDDLCTIVGDYSGGSHLPYISVSTGAKEHRTIFSDGVTCLHIECNKKGTYNGHPYVKHHTEQLKSTDKLNALNGKVIEKIKKRLEANNTDRMRKMELQFNEILELSDDCGEESEPEDYDYSDNVSVSCDIGGYKD